MNSRRGDPFCAQWRLCTLRAAGLLIVSSKRCPSIVFHERISQSDLAAIAGVARENVNRILSEWRLRKLITGSGRYCLTNIATLKLEMNSGPR
jgi:hypothetical protein